MSEYQRNYNWFYNNMYNRGVFEKDMECCPGYNFLPYEINSMRTYEKINTNKLVEQYLKAHPHLDTSGILKKKWRKIEPSANSTNYRDEYKRHVNYPSMANYEEIANKVLKAYQPTPEPSPQKKETAVKVKDENVDLSSGIIKYLNLDKSFSLKYDPNNKHKLVESEKETIRTVPEVPKLKYGYSNPSSPPIITDMGNKFYRRDLDLRISKLVEPEDISNEMAKNAIESIKKENPGRHMFNNNRKYVTKRYTNFIIS